MADELTTTIAMTDATLTSSLGLPENRFGTNIISLIAPDVQVYNRTFKARVFGKDMYRKIARVGRPRGGDAQRVTTEYADPKSFAIEEKTLKDVLDRRDMEEAQNAPDGGFDLRLRTALMIQNNLLTTIEAGAAAMFLDENNYGAGSSDAIGTTFSGTGTLGLIEAAQNLIIKTWAIRPNTLILTPEAWTEVMANTTIHDRIKYTDGDTLTEDRLARYLQLDKVIVPRTVYFEDGVGSYVWAGKKALLLYTNQNAGMNGPSFAKTFYRLVNGEREYVKSAFDMPGNEHLYVVREEETYMVFPDAGFLWY